MSGSEELIDTIEAIYAAGLDVELWPAALAAVTKLVGGVGATLEVIDRRTRSHLEFHAHGTPAPHEMPYLDHYAALSPRIPHALRQPQGQVVWEYLVADESEMTRSPFYTEFLAPLGMKYAAAGILHTPKTEFAACAIQRSPQQGHVGDPEISLIRRLVPHLSQALDMSRRLETASRSQLPLERVLDLLGDGVALISINGSVVYTNISLRALIDRKDGVRLHRGYIEFDDAPARDQFRGATAAVTAHVAAECSSYDFVAHRRTAAPPYFISVRRLPRSEVTLAVVGEPIAIVFVRDPMEQGTATVQILRSVFGLTEAEASLARAIQTGISPLEYARNRSLSTNTVYTHLRRVREKTGCRRLSELIAKLNELHLPLRS
jgi:DNA-binding CsgD family transcriptional regulator/PAS domain-containing protein